MTNLIKSLQKIEKKYIVNGTKSAVQTRFVNDVIWSFPV